VDPKRLELAITKACRISSLRFITEPSSPPNALRNAVREMERRLKLLAEKGVRTWSSTTSCLMMKAPAACSAKIQKIDLCPTFVIIIDELADLMMLDSGNVEESVTRLAQMARALAFHLVLATQRPSVDVITA